MLLAGFGRKLKSVLPVSSWWSNCLAGGELSRWPQCASVQPGPHPTRKERPVNSPASINKLPCKTTTTHNINYHCGKMIPFHFVLCQAEKTKVLVIRKVVESFINYKASNKVVMSLLFTCLELRTLLVFCGAGGDRCVLVKSSRFFCEQSATSFLNVVFTIDKQRSTSCKPSAHCCRSQ